MRANRFERNKKIIINPKSPTMFNPKLSLIKEEGFNVEYNKKQVEIAKSTQYHENKT